MIEGRNLVDLNSGQFVFFSKRNDMIGRNMAIAILQPVQVLDEQITLERQAFDPVADCCTHRRPALPALGLAATPAPSGSGRCHAVRGVMIMCD